MKTQIVGLKVGGSYGDIAVADARPLFSYLLKSEEDGCYQTARRIVVAKTEDDVKALQALCWDSGVVQSPKTWGIEYDGEPLEDLTDYYYRVFSCVNGGSEPVESPVCRFFTAFVRSSGFDADWIGGDTLLRKTFVLEAPVVSAKIAVTGLAYFELYINGKKIGDDTLSPSYTWYNKRVEYHTYDVTEHLCRGDNAIGIMLGGHWEQSPDWSRNNCYQGCYWRGPLKAKALLCAVLADGRTVRIPTDGTWKCAPGPVVSSSVYDGERYDARLEKPGFSHPGDDGGEWRPVSVIPDSGAKLVGLSMPPIRRIRKTAPASVERLDNGDFLVDFGVNIAGRCRVLIDEPEGAEVTIRHAEVRFPGGGIDARNLRWAKARDVYISRGTAAVYEPRFTYHGFRYAQISGLTRLDPKGIEAVEVRTALSPAGSFECSDAFLNNLHEIMCRTLANNMHSIPTDCCQRDERQGWMGDGQLCCEAVCTNFDAQYFYRKWLSDIADCQDEETGNIPYMTAPAWIAGEALAWTCAYYEVAYQLLRYYDDRQAVARHYPGLSAYYRYLRTREDSDGLLTLSGLCDWLAPEPTEEGNIRDALYFRFAVVMEKMARALGKDEDAHYYAAEADRIRKAYNKRYYSPHKFTDKRSGYYGTCYYVGQAANAIPISFGIVDGGDFDRVAEKLVYELTESMGDTRLTTGFIGTKALFEALILLGRCDIAFDLLKREDYPSWGFMIRNGATTVWERWQYRTDNEMNSHCHPPLAAPDVWFYQAAAGIRGMDIADDCLCEFHIEPCVELPLSYVKASRSTPFGDIEVHWEKDDGVIWLCVDVPANTRAVVRCGGEDRWLSSGRHCIVVEKGDGCC